MILQEMIDAIVDIEYKDWEIKISQRVGSYPYLQVTFWSEGHEQKGRKWMLSSYMTKSEVVQTAFLAILKAEEHEIREQFRYKGRLIYGPHFDVDVLADVAGREENLDMRTGAWVA